MKTEEIKEMISLLEKSNLSSLRLKKGDFELHLEKQVSLPAAYNNILPQAQSVKIVEKDISQPSLPSPSSEESSNDCFVTSPMVGTYYSTPGPNEKPFVKIGDVVEEGTVICIIEAMKVMNEVKAGMRGRIKEFYCKSSQPVEFGTKICRIEPL